jgi:hypothetical protein
MVAAISIRRLYLVGDLEAKGLEHLPLEFLGSPA